MPGNIRISTFANMNSISDISEMRWFMGKGRAIDTISSKDSTVIGKEYLSIKKILFKDGEFDYYSILNENANVGQILDEAFSGESLHKIFLGSQGFFIAYVFEQIPSKSLISMKSTEADQSNSSYFVPGKYFFKLFRRLQPDPHPEREILLHLNNKGYTGVAKIFGEISYHANSNESFTLGILEEHFDHATNAWTEFNKKMDCEAAQELGKQTARMHQALADMNGLPPIQEEVPFQKLEKLLHSTISHGSGKAELKKLAQKVLDILPTLKIKCETAFQNKKISNNLFAPQRIHGDFHLGQILITQDYPSHKSFKILDFEGEPSRTMDYRRALRSPAVDIASMLRSFRYASATSKQDSRCVEQAFIEGYALAAGINPLQLQDTISPYILAKTIYEACYELEFRPDWFWIPAQSILH